MPLYSYSKPVKPRKIKIIEIDLSTARNDEVIFSGYITSISILQRGNGSYSLKLIYLDGSSETYSREELLSGMVFENIVKEIRFTNTAQSDVINPRIAVEYEVR